VAYCRSVSRRGDSIRGAATAAAIVAAAIAVILIPQQIVTASRATRANRADSQVTLATASRLHNGRGRLARRRR
jgi:hypothetical protein